MRTCADFFGAVTLPVCICTARRANTYRWFRCVCVRVSAHQGIRSVEGPKPSFASVRLFVSSAWTNPSMEEALGRHACWVQLPASDSACRTNNVNCVTALGDWRAVGARHGRIPSPVGEVKKKRTLFPESLRTFSKHLARTFTVLELVIFATKERIFFTLGNLYLIYIELYHPRKACCLPTC